MVWLPVVFRLVPVAAPNTGVTITIEVLVHAEILPDATVPKIGAVNVGVVIVGAVANTAEPVPVSSVSAARKFALEGVPKKSATPAPKLVMPVPPLATARVPVVFAIGNPVQLVRTPEAGVPSAGVTRVGLVNKSALVTCLVVPDCTIGKTSVTAAAVAAGREVIAMVAMLVVSCVNVESLAVSD